MYLFDDLKRDPTGVVVDLMEYIGVDTAFVPDTAVRYNPASVPRSRTLNRLYFHPTLVRTAKAMLPEGGQSLAKRLRARNLQSPPTFPPDLRADLLAFYRDDILALEELIDRDLSVLAQRRARRPRSRAESVEQAGELRIAAASCAPGRSCG